MAAAQSAVWSQHSGLFQNVTITGKAIAVPSNIKQELYLLIFP